MSRRPLASRSLSLALGAAIGIVMLVGCTAQGPTVSTPPSSETATPPAASTAPSASAAPAITIPDDCRTVVSAETYAKVFGDTPLNDPAFGTPGAGKVAPVAPRAGASAEETLRSAVQLWCTWAHPEADITGLTLTMATVDPAVATVRLAELAAEGYSCSDLLDGRRCQLIRPNASYQVEEGFTEFLRDDVYITVVQANFPTSGLLDEIVAHLSR